MRGNSADLASIGVFLTEEGSFQVAAFGAVSEVIVAVMTPFLVFVHGYKMGVMAFFLFQYVARRYKTNRMTAETVGMLSQRIDGLVALTRFAPGAEGAPMRFGDAPSAVVLVELATGAETRVATTRGADSQLGAQVQWGATDSDLFFNDIEVPSQRLQAARKRRRDYDETSYDSFDNICGFSPSDAEELMCQGVKPWDADAGAVLAALGAGDDSSSVDSTYANSLASL